MTLTNEDLLAISQLLDEKLDAKFDEKLDEKFYAKLDAKLDEKLDEKFYAKLDAKLDARIKPLENRLKRIEVDLLENNVIPRLNTIEACYIETYNRYKDYVDKMDATFSDVELLKKVVEEHSKILQKIG